MLSAYQQSVLATGGIAAIGALGLYLTLLSGQFSVIHAAFAGMGGYAAGVLSVSSGWPFWPTLLAGALLGGLAGAIVGTMVQRMAGMLLGMATLALGQAISLAVIHVDPLGGALGYSGVPLRTTFEQVVLILGIVLLTLAWFRRTRVGLAMTAVGKDEAVAEALGISARAMRIWGFGLGGGLAGLSGALLAQFTGLIEPTQLGFNAEVQLFIFVIIGGISTPWGAVLGAIGLTWGLEMMRFATLDRFWILGVLLTAVVLLRPNGVLVRRPLTVGSSDSPGTA
jgi:branched-chain amino acid transport system permease protein